MSEDAKFFVRPKVRFCQTDASEPVAKELKNSIDQKNGKQSNKPRIRSIVTVNKPVKLLKSNKTRKGHENKDIDNVQKSNSLTVCTNALPLSMVPTTSLNENSVGIEDQKPLSDNKNVQNIKANSKETESKTSNKPSSSDVVLSTSSDVQGKNLNKISKSQNYVKSQISKGGMKNKRGKENDALDVKKNSKNTTKKFSELEITKHKVKPCTVDSNAKKSNVASKISLPPKRNLNSKSNIIDVMPCHKYTKIVSKTKTSPVKKIVVRDIIGPKIKPYIGSGVSHKRQSNLSNPGIDESTYSKPSISGENLARPEYNSIMCTINKLHEIKKQKVVTDMENLPAAYKHFINGKISTALDFPLDKAIYTNLVDLSIDENHLPSRLTRSKDPEPRQRDAVPVLSDFFTPVSTEEYCTSVFSKPRTPEVIDSWSAFRISDKIFEWKHILDHV